MNQMKKMKAVKPSLRESQKRERRREILEAAQFLILERGYDGATIEDIAEKARLSAPTVYNYFGTKADLLLALYQEDREIAVAKMETLLTQNWKDPIDLIIAIFTADFHGEVIGLNRALWRQITATEVAASGSPQGKIFSEQNERIRLILRRALKKSADAGQLPMSSASSIAADLLYAVNDYVFRHIIETDDKTFNHFRAQARQLLSTVIAGLRAQVK